MDEPRVRRVPENTRSHPVIEVTELEGVIFNYRSRNERAASVDDARHLRERAAPLIAWAKDLPALRLAIADPGVKPVAKLQAGQATMSAAMLAA